MSEPRDEQPGRSGPPRGFDPADKTQPAEGGRDEVDESLDRMTPAEGDRPDDDASDASDAPGA